MSGSFSFFLQQQSDQSSFCGVRRLLLRCVSQIVQCVVPILQRRVSGCQLFYLSGQSPTIFRIKETQIRHYSTPHFKCK